MASYLEKKENQSVSTGTNLKRNNGRSSIRLVDNRPEAVVQRKLKEVISSTSTPIQFLRSRTEFRQNTTNMFGLRGSDGNLHTVDNLLTAHAELLQNEPSAVAPVHAHQMFSDRRLASLHGIQQHLHTWLNLKRDEPDNKYRAGVNELLDEVQTEHREQITNVDQQNLRLHMPDQEHLSHAERTQAQNDWNTIRNGTGNVTIHDSAIEQRGTGDEYRPANFRNEALAMHARLLGNNTGRNLIHSVLQGGHNVDVLPQYRSDDMGMMPEGGASAAAVDEVNARATNHADHVTLGTGSGSVIRVEAGMRDSQHEMNNAGRTTANPSHIIFGHELVHAVHNQRGRNLRNIPNPDIDMHQWTNLEEHQTITGQGLSENTLRDEENLTIRSSHN
ncbi:MAG: hypothetical protein GQ574_25765 [Crocinitomix sp.]|nr:hypothetical protein [Crocinitomix sp.]